MSTLEIIGVTKRYTSAGDPAVTDATITVNSGTVAALVGESGAGKSTLLRLIAGLEQPDAGEIRLDGRLLSSSQGVVPPERRGIGFVFQSHALFPHLNVYDNITFGLRGMPPAARRDEAERLLALVRLSGYDQRMPHELSGGERQRIALARTLAPRPGIVLLDEPFSSLDASLKTELRGEMRDILRQIKVTALLVTHDRGDALALADRITVINAGRIEQTGESHELYARPASRYVAAFFGDCNFLPGHVFARLAPGRWSGLYRTAGNKELWIRPGDLQLVPATVAEAMGGLKGRISACRFIGEYWEIRVQPLDTALPTVLVYTLEPMQAGPVRDGSVVGVLPKSGPSAVEKSIS